MAFCPNCAAGRRPEWQAQTREYIHHVVAAGGPRSHSLCTSTLPAPDGGYVRSPQLRKTET